MLLLPPVVPAYVCVVDDVALAAQFACLDDSEAVDEDERVGTCSRVSLVDLARCSTDVAGHGGFSLKSAFESPHIGVSKLALLR